MRSYKDAKAMAKSLRDVLAARNVSFSHSECLEVVAQQFGFANWNTLSSKLTAEEQRPAQPGDLDTVLPSTAMAPRAPEASLQSVPVVPLRDVVVYPGMLIPLFAGRPKTIHAAETAMRGDKRVLLITQRQLDVSEPTADDLYEIGTVANVMKLTAGPHAMSWQILVEGVMRTHLDVLHAEEDHVSAQVTVLNDIQTQNSGDTDLLKTAVMTRFEQYVRLHEWPNKAWKTPPDQPGFAEILRWFSALDVGRFTDTIAAHMPLRLAQKQEVLEILDVHERLIYVDAATKELEQTGPA
jgi:ATP-dependent Lon protease